MAGRMKWTRHPELSFIFVSGCGRFEVGGSIWTKGGGVYVRLLDTKTGREFPCRTEASAKTAARNILTSEGAS